MKRYIAFAIFSQFFLCSQSLGKRDKTDKQATTQQVSTPSTSGQTIVFQSADPFVYQQMIQALQQASLLQQVQMQQEQQSNKKSSEESKFIAAAVSIAANLFLCVATQKPEYLAQMFKEAAQVIGRRVHITIDDEEITPESTTTTEISVSVTEQTTEVPA